MKNEEPFRLQDFVESLIIALLLAAVVRTFCLGVFKIPTSTMFPTLRPGDFVFSNKLAFGLKVPFTILKFGKGEIKAGDLIVYHYPDKPDTPFVKRVIGLPGDRIFIDGRKLTINDKELTLKEISNHESIQELSGHEHMKLYEEILSASPEIKYQVMYVDSPMVPSRPMGPLVVSPDHVFVLGDNRDAADDSRYWGPVPVDQVESRLFMIWLSLDWSEGIPHLRWSHMGSL